MKLLLATNNLGKQREFGQLLNGLPGLELVTPQDLGLELDVDEVGATYAENAALKASAFSQASGMLVLADDSGLEVDALQGAPGLHSARYSPKAGATDADRRALLLTKLAGLPRPWTARFRATLALVVPGQAIRYAKGVCPGEIVPQGRGEGGFGYDPIFIVAGTNQTMCEISEHAKNKLSHRGNAVRAALPILKEMLLVEWWY